MIEATTYTPRLKDGVEIYEFKSPQQAVEYVYSLLSTQISRHAALMVSHGEYVGRLLALIARYESLEPHSVIMTEELMGEPFHSKSVEEFYNKKGIIDSLSKRGIPFYRILSRAPTLQATTRIYSTRIEEVLQNARVAHSFVELSDTGAVGGFFPTESRVSSIVGHADDYAIGFVVEDGMQKIERVALTSHAMKHAAVVWLFAFGESKRKALRQLFGDDRKEGPVAALRSLPSMLRVFTDLHLR